MLEIAVDFNNVVKDTKLEDRIMDILDAIAELGVIGGGGWNDTDGHFAFYAHKECDDDKCDMPLLKSIHKRVKDEIVGMFTAAGFTVVSAKYTDSRR